MERDSSNPGPCTAFLQRVLWAAPLVCCLVHAPGILAQNGTQIWDFVTTEAILTSPAIGADGTIYFGSYDRKIHAITPAGSNKWAFTLPGGGFTGLYSSPAVGLDGTIYFGGEDGNVYAVTNGSMKWSFPAGDAV